ncbi:restriction endonuclease subunit S [Candidatus Poribacteria bacterium]|nr:restriction endonuclease subunit S [Candidatus Poribacteria bacterium]MYK95008.1 restriction endonuclease subunit S [Candidatus Poribacteria bacterium]
MQFKTRKLSYLSLHPDFRWDSQYLSCESYKNKNLKYVPIGNTLTSSQYGVSIEMNEDNIGTKIYRMNEISNMLCDRNILKYAELNDNQIAAFKLKDRDVLFNRTNSKEFVGRTGIFKKFSDEDIVFASYLVRINPDPEIVTPEYLTAFLNTKYGIIDIKRRARHSINQSNVNLEEVKRIEIPLLCNQLQGEITLSFNKAFDSIQASEAVYNNAQTLLLSELGLSNWQPEHRLTFVKSFSDTESTGRIDAGYFQPKYDDIVDAIKNYSGGWDTLKNLAQVKDTNFNPDAETEYKYIELANIGSNGEITDCVVEQGEDLPTRARRKVAAGDVIVSSIEGSLESIALITEEYDNALCSTGFHVIQSDVLNSKVLLVLLKSIVGQLQLKKRCSGTILTAINKVECSKIALPKIKKDKQSEIEQNVDESFNLREHAKDLLECAKRAVEIAIEQDEQTAIRCLESVSKPS